MTQERAVVRFDPKEKAATISRSLEDRRGQLLSLLGGDERLTSRFLTVTLDAVVKSKDVLEADPLSIVNAVRDAAMLGLEPAGALGDGALVAYRDNDQGGKKIAQFQPMYRGLMKLARQSGMVDAIDAAIVYEKDVFDYVRGTDPKIVHAPSLEEDPGAIKGAYAYAKLSSGELVVRYWTAGKLLKHRDRFARSKKFWLAHPEPMMLKTVVRDLVKYLPLGFVASKALAHDEAIEYGAPEAPVTGVAQAAIAGGSRLRARLNAGDDVDADPAQNGSGDADGDDAGSDTAQAGNDAQGPSDAGSGVATKDPETQPAAGERCGVVSTDPEIAAYGGCELKPGHRALHRNEVATYRE